MTADIQHLPLPENCTAKELLDNCSTREFADVLILGYGADGGLKYAGTLNDAHRLHLIETYKLILLGVIDGASRNAK